MKHWIITYDYNGGIVSCVELTGPADKDWTIVQAEDEASARKAAYNLYCSRTKAQVRVIRYANGDCVCGRKQDRPHPSGDGMYKTCIVCAERQSHRAKKGDAPRVRDEAARVEKCAERRRERKKEMRIEVLLEVRKRWRDAKSYRHFEVWLEAEVEAML